MIRTSSRDRACLVQFAIVALPMLLVACGRNDADSAPMTGSATGAGSDVHVFDEVASECGIEFRHVAGISGEYYFPEINGAGGAFLDYDGDGDLDVYLVQGGPLDSRPGDAAENGVVNRLFRNDLTPAGELRFADVTDTAGVGDEEYGMGVATGDIDNDGDVDLYVMNYGRNVMYRNDGDGSFTDITAQSATGYEGWSASGSFCDYDRDGDLDLFVANYIFFDTASNRPCLATGGQRDYCAPDQYPADSDRLYRNEGGGVFRDVSDTAGISSKAGPGLGVTCADLDGDDWPDFYVANDQAANHLWINARDGSFRETGLMSGAAYNINGAAEASMGITAGDYDGDGDDDLFMTHLNTQSNTLYVNDGSGVFRDATDQANLGATSLMYTGFGSSWLDFDNDSDLDLYVANGAVMAIPERRAVSAHPYEQRDQLFENDGNGQFREIAGAGVKPEVPITGRGAAFGDVDNDGDTDILVTGNNGPAQLLRNVVGAHRHWLRVVVEGSVSNRGGQGARVMLRLADGTEVWRRAHTDGSYASAGDPRVLFGLGEETAVDSVTVKWPTGATESWPPGRVDAEVKLKEGTGTPAAE